MNKFTSKHFKDYNYLRRAINVIECMACDMDADFREPITIHIGRCREDIKQIDDIISTAPGYISEALKDLRQTHHYNLGYCNECRMNNCECIKYALPRATTRYLNLLNKKTTGEAISKAGFPELKYALKMATLPDERKEIKKQVLDWVNTYDYRFMGSLIILKYVEELTYKKISQLIFRTQDQSVSSNRFRYY